MKKELRKLFESNTEHDTVFTTSDGQHFWHRNHAEAHASGLANKAISTTTRGDAMADESYDEKVSKIVARKAEIEATIAALNEEHEALSAEHKALAKSEAKPVDSPADDEGGKAATAKASGSKGSTKSAKK